MRAIVAAIPGSEILDVGIGTGIAARQFREAGCRILGVDVDLRMAAFARACDLEVEVSRFEEWEPSGRRFDGVVAGQTWHWVEPVAGAAKAAEVLRPGGRLAAFWNVFQFRPEQGEALSAVYRRVLPDTPFAGGVSGGMEAYAPIFTRTAEGMRAPGLFDEPEQWHFDWEHAYTTEEWLDQVPTAGGHSRFPPATLDQLLNGLGAVIDALGSRLDVQYTAVVVTAVRRAEG